MSVFIKSADTKTPVSNSRAEIEKILRRYGAVGFNVQQPTPEIPMSSDGKVFYVLARRPELAGSVRSWWLDGDDWTYSIERATRATSLRKLTDEYYEEADPFLPTTAEFSRVTSVTEPPCREPVTSGDLSLLDGPCVVQNSSGFFASRYTGNATDIANATVFDDQPKALLAVGWRAIARGVPSDALRIIPVREVPGTTKYVEEVLE